LIFYVRATRFFGDCPKAAHISLGLQTDSQVLGKFHETVERYVLVDRHSHLSREHSIELHRSLIERDLLSEFRGNVSVYVGLSDEDCYQQHVKKGVVFDCELGARLR
jgi:hypothetical protein